MAGDFLKALCIGMLITIIACCLAAAGMHNSVLHVLTMPLVFPLVRLAEIVGYALTRGQAGETRETVQLYGLMTLFGALIYGSLAFLVIVGRKRTRQS